MPTMFPKFSKRYELSTFTVAVETMDVKITAPNTPPLTFDDESIWMAIYCDTEGTPREEIGKALWYSSVLRKVEDIPDWPPASTREITISHVNELLDLVEGSPADLFISTMVNEGKDHVDPIHGSLTEKLLKLFQLSLKKYRTERMGVAWDYPNLLKRYDEDIKKSVAEQDKKVKEQQEEDRIKKLRAERKEYMKEQQQLDMITEVFVERKRRLQHQRRNHSI
ncbi:MAG: hypothetical protein LQ345_005326 [Seirophora villosa]|nr:MAG: hypothetical protein LQ345_005326 [Seirophora villosa]